MSAARTLYFYLKSTKRKLRVHALRALATAVLVQYSMVVRCGRNGLIDLFPPAFVFTRR